MLAGQAEILHEYGDAGVIAIRNIIPKATGKTAASVTYAVDAEGLKIFARGFFEALETGRGPRKSSTDEGMKDNILEWMAARGIGSGLDAKKKERLAKFLTLRINQKGDKTFRTGGKSIYTPIINQLVKELTNALAKHFTETYSEKIVELTKQAV